MADEESMYGEGDEAPPPEANAKPDGEGEPKPEGEEGAGGDPILVPESACPGMEVGQSMVLTVKEKMDGQYRCEYEPEPKEKAPEKLDVAEKPSDPEMAEMMD